MKIPPDQDEWGAQLVRFRSAEARVAAGLTAHVSLPPFEVWRSRDFLVQMFREDGWVRMTVNRTHMLDDDDWADGITWDDLQRLKSECGRGGSWAVELYPPDADVVNDANMRHLWLLGDPPPFAWTA